MSGTNFEVHCPNCQSICHAYTDSKPFENTSMSCSECGFYTNTVIGYMDLVELNEQREVEMKHPLKELPEQTFKY